MRWYLWPWRIDSLFGETEKIRINHADLKKYASCICSNLFNWDPSRDCLHFNRFPRQIAHKVKFHKLLYRAANGKNVKEGMPEAAF